MVEMTFDLTNSEVMAALKISRLSREQLEKFIEGYHYQGHYKARRWSSVRLKEWQDLQHRPEVIAQRAAQNEARLSKCK